MATTEQVIEAVNALYSNPDPALKSQADHWLNEFSESSMAWSISLPLLRHHSMEVSYFSANLLLTKVRKQWKQLDMDQKSFLLSAMTQLLQSSIAEPSSSPIVVNRISLLVAAVVARTPKQTPDQVDMDSLLRSSFQTVRTSQFNSHGVHAVTVALSLFLAIAEELEYLDRSSRITVVRVMKEKREELFTVIQDCVGRFFSNPNSNPAIQASLQLPILQTTKAWIQTRSSESSRSSMAATTLNQNHPILFQFLLHSLGSQDALAAEAAMESLVELISAWDESQGLNPRLQYDTLRSVIQAVVSQSAAIHSGDREFFHEDVERGLCQVAVAVSESMASIIGSAEEGCEEGLSLAEMMLRSAVEGDEGMVDSAVEFFSMLNTIPVEQRRQPFQRDVYGRLLQVLVQKAQYPPDFDSWQKSNLDEDTFHRFRDQVLADGLETCYNLLGFQFLHFLLSLLQGSAGWQQAESAIFGIRSISSSIRIRFLNPDAAQPPAEESAAMDSFLSALFTTICQNASSTLFFSHPLLVESTSRLIGGYAPWFNTNPSLLEPALTYLLRALQVPAAVSHASVSFRNICARCSAHLKSEETIQRLAQVADSALPADSLSRAGDEDRQAVIEGLAKVVASLPHPQRSIAAEKLFSPLVNRCQQLAGDLTESSPAGVLSAALCTQMKVLATAVKHCETREYGAVVPTPDPVAASNPGSPLNMAMMVAGSPRWRTNDEVVQSACAVVTSCLLNARVAPQVMVQHLGTAVSLFEEFQYPCCLDVLTEAMEVCIRQPGSNVQLFQDMLVTVFQAGFRLLQAGRLAYHPEVFKAILDMSYRSLLFHPAVLLGPTSTSIIFQILPPVLQNQERDSCKAAVSFLTFLLSPAHLSRNRSMVDECIQQYGQLLTHSLLYAICDVLARDLIRPMAAVLHSLIKWYPSLVPAWMISSLGDPRFPATANGSVGQVERSLFCSVAFREPLLARPRFEAMMQDFASLSRREGTSDMLVAYQF